MAQQQADALALLAETALHHELDPGAPGERYQVVVHVDAPVLADPDQPGQSVLEDLVEPAKPVRLAVGAGDILGGQNHEEALAVRPFELLLSDDQARAEAARVRGDEFFGELEIVGRLPVPRRSRADNTGCRPASRSR
jgi:hypothetical protein